MVTRKEDHFKDINVKYEKRFKKAIETSMQMGNQRVVDMMKKAGKKTNINPLNLS